MIGCGAAVHARALKISSHLHVAIVPVWLRAAEALGTNWENKLWRNSGERVHRGQIFENVTFEAEESGTVYSSKKETDNPFYHPAPICAGISRYCL